MSDAAAAEVRRYGGAARRRRDVPRLRARVTTERAALGGLTRRDRHSARPAPVAPVRRNSPLD